MSPDGSNRGHSAGGSGNTSRAFDGNDSSIDSISQEPVSILFAPHSVVDKSDVWQIDLIRILEILTRILQRSNKSDLRVAGMAALASSLIYKKKVETISALHKAAMERKPMPAGGGARRADILRDADLIDIPYRHEPMYPVSFEDLLDVLQNLMNAMARPEFRSGQRSVLDRPEPPVFEDYLLSLEGEIDAYRNMIMNAVAETGRCILQDLIDGMDSLESIRCFFASLFLAREGLVDLEQIEDDIRIVAIPQTEGDSDHTE